MLQTLLNNRWVVLISRLIVGGIFTFAGYIKLLEPIEDFIQVGHSWNILPDPWLTIYITPLPWLEFIFGLGILLGVFQKVSATFVGLMLLSFIIAITVNVFRGTALEDCGCFGGAFHFGETFPQLLWRDLLLMLGTLIIGFTKQTWLSVDAWLER